jgi:hypothetical protein
LETYSAEGTKFSIDKAVVGPQAGQQLLIYYFFLPSAEVNQFGTFQKKLLDRCNQHLLSEGAKPWLNAVLGPQAGQELH